MPIYPPGLPETLTPVENFSAYAKPLIADDATLAEIRVEAEQSENADFYKMDIRRSVFSGCVFHKCGFEKAGFIDVAFENCDFSNCDFQGAYFERCWFTSCKCVGTDMVGAMLKHTAFETCNLQYANLNTVKCVGVRFSHTDCTEASVAEAKLKYVTAEKSTFLRNDFHQTLLAGIDFSDNVFMSPIVSSPPVELKGIVVDPLQTADLVAIWGIKVKQPLPQREPSP